MQLVLLPDISLPWWWFGAQVCHVHQVARLKRALPAIPCTRALLQAARSVLQVEICLSLCIALHGGIACSLCARCLSTLLCCLLTVCRPSACRMNATFAILSVAMSSVWLSLIAGEVVALLEALGHIWGFDTVRGRR